MPRTPKSTNRSTNGEIELRVAKVVELLAAGVNRASVIRFAAEKTDWRVSDRTIDKYLQRAHEAIAKQAGVEREFVIGKALTRLDDLYRKAFAIQDYKTCLAVMKEHNRLMGLGNIPLLPPAERK